MTAIDLTLATAPQLAVLLDLSAEEAERVARAGPFTDLQALRAALPEHRRGIALPEKIEKPDLNAATQQTLVDALGLAPELAAKVLDARPFYFITELARIPGLPRNAVLALASAFGSPRLAWRDKTRDKEISVSPNPEKLVVVAQPEAESGDFERRLLGTGVRAVSVGGGATYNLFVVPQTENAGNVVHRVREEPTVDRVIPAMRDASGEDIFLDPAYVVVQFAANLPPAAQDDLLRDAGLELERRHRAAGLVTAKVPGGTKDPGCCFAAIERLNLLAEVEFAEPAFIGFDDLDDGSAIDSEHGSALPVATALAWHLSAIRAADAWNITRGHPDVVIAIVDSGIDADHAAFANAVLPRGDEDWNFESPIERRPIDLLGHGSFVAALAVGRDPAHGELGLAPDCKILPLKIPLSGSLAAYADRRAAILYSLDKVAAGQRLVINLSWKTSGDPASVRTAIETAVQRGAVVVASAGNWPEYENQPHYPSDYPDVISVGAIAQDNARAPYSFFGSGVDIAAPGGNGASDPNGDLVSAAIGGGYRSDFGTSFAAPQVAAAAALLLSRDRSLPVNAVRRLILDSALPRPGAGLGAGLLDVGAALYSLGIPREGPTPTPVPEPSPVPGPGSAPPGSPAPPSSSGLDAVNSLDIDALVARYQMLPLTARLIAARRPIADLDEIRTVLGMTPDVFARIAGDGATPARAPDEASSIPESEPPEGRLLDANDASLEELLGIDGLLPITARLIVAGRPHPSREALLGLLGMTPSAAEHLSV